MGTKKRRLRELAAREQLFINTALEHIQKNGLLALKMAQIARECDYATGTLYQHFSSKEDLLLAISADQHQKRLSIIKRAAEWDAPSRDKMVAMAIADILFALHHPMHLRLNQYIFTDAVWRSASKSRREQVVSAYSPHSDYALGIIQQGLEEGALVTTDQKLVELTLGQWCLTMGMHTIVHADGVVEHLNIEQPYRWLIKHLNVYLNGLNWQPLLDPFNETELNNNIHHICDAIFSDLTSDLLFTKEASS